MINAIDFNHGFEAKYSFANYGPRVGYLSAVCFLDERWKWIHEFIPELQPWYLISNYGRVYSIVREHFLSSSIINSGYERVTFRTVDNGSLDLLVHRLVALAFIENPNGYNQVNHDNGNKTFNVYHNLFWVNQSLNNIHAYENNLTARGEDASFSRFTNDEVHKICQHILDGKSYGDIVRLMFPTDNNHEHKKLRNCIYQIAIGRNWKHISLQYGIGL